MPDIELGRYDLEENDTTGNLEVRDPNGNVLFEWDETAGEWDFANQSIGNLGSLSTDDATHNDSYTDPAGVSHSGEIADLANLFSPTLNINFPFPMWQMKKSSGGGSVTFTDRQIQLREPGNASSTDESRAYDDIIEFDPSVLGRVKIYLSNITIDANSGARIGLEITDAPDGSFTSGGDLITGEVRGNGDAKFLLREDGDFATTLDTGRGNSFVSALNYIQVSFDGSTGTLEASDGSTTVTVSESSNYPTGESLFLKIVATDQSSSGGNNVDFDVDAIEVGT